MNLAKVSIVFTHLGLIGCSYHSPGHTTSHTKEEEVIIEKDTTSRPDKKTTIFQANMGPAVTEERKLEIGEVLPDLSDSTLLTFIYESCYLKEGVFTFNNGVQIWDEEDSVYMQVENSFGDDYQQIIYIRGAMALTCVMHNFFCETAIVVCHTAQGWVVTDGYIDEQIIDFSAVEMEGIYDGRFLLSYRNSGTYSWGIEFGQERYVLLDSAKITGAEVNFVTNRSNKFTDQCFNYDSIPDYHCDCYDSEGDITYSYDSTLKSLVFNYSYRTTSADCEMLSPVTDSITQIWYMNANTSFIASGHELGEWGEGIFDEVKLSETEIRKRLGF